LIIQGFLPVAVVLLTRLVVDSLVDVIDKGVTATNLQPLLISVLMMGIVLLAQLLLNSASSYVRIAQSERVKDYISEIVFQKSTSVDLAFYDSPKYFDHLHRATFDAGSRPIALLESIGSLLQNSITLFAMALVLIPYAWWLPVALFLSTLPALYVVLQHRTRFHRWSLATTKDDRRAWYYQYSLTARETASELRLFGLGGLFRERFTTLRARLREERLKLQRDQGFSEMFAGILALAITGLAMFWMLAQIVRGVYSLGDMALFYSAFNQGQTLMRTLMSHVGEIYSNSLFLGDLFEFLDLESQVVNPASPEPAPESLQQSITFEDVWFSYPGSDRPVVRGLNLEIPAGKIIAIVGMNGAGKSTLIKLLCRFYDPQRGVIKLDGTDIRFFAVDALRRQITALFQEPMQYQETAAMNIGFGNVFVEPEFQAIKASAEASGAAAVIDKYPDGYDTLLGKLFETGVDLSVGEWQRIALARAFYRDAPIIVLDEPTSAMDPWAEADWLNRLRKLAKGRTAILITHRFTTAAYADIIHVMDGGQIVEAGDHQELLNSGGRYAESWREQMMRWLPSLNAEKEFHAPPT
jgi:ATP-binding cassette, subfamily B, bacterial